MNLKELKNTQQLQTFLDGAQAIVFTIKKHDMTLSYPH